MPLYLLLDAFLEMRVLAPKIQCSGARITEVVIASSFDFKALEEVKVLPVRYANLMFGMRLGSDDAALISLDAIQSMQHIQVMCVRSPIM